MQKQVSIVSFSLLSLALIASCSSNVPVANVNKVDSVSVSQINKTPAQDLSVSVNLKLLGTQPKFGIKAFQNAWTSVGSGNISKITLNLYNSAGTSAGNRFDTMTPLATKAITPGTFSAGIFDAPGIKFNNLKPSTSYYVSARAYSTAFNNNIGTIDISASAALTGTIKGVGTSWNTGGRNRVWVGDIVSFNDGSGARNITVTGITDDTTLTFNTASNTPITGGGTPTYTVETNVTGVGTLGGSMAADGTAPGGGTAPGLATIATDEESISLNTAGTLTINNDGQFNASSPVRVAGPDSKLDVAIQIMRDFGGSADGAVRVYQGGNATGTETII